LRYLSISPSARRPAALQLRPAGAWFDFGSRLGENSLAHSTVLRVSLQPAGGGVSDWFPAIQEFESGQVIKSAPISEGKSEKRKRKPHIIAVINECCTGCAGSPACVEYCPVENCMFWMKDGSHPPFGRIVVDPLLCIGCKLCTSKGPDGAFLEGCPWDAIDLLPLAEFEAKYGKLPY
jgi:ferredoxin